MSGNPDVPFMTDAISPKQAAHLLGYNVVTLAKWRDEGRGPSYTKIGPRYWYRRVDILEWLQRHRVETIG